MDGLNNLLAQVGQIQAAMQQGLHTGVAQATEYVSTEMKAYFDSGGGGSWTAHHDNTTKRHGAHSLLKLTGALYGSIMPKSSGAVGHVYFDGSYGKYHETSTSKMPARPFIKPVVEKTRQEVAEMIAAAVMAAVGGVGGVTVGGAGKGGKGYGASVMTTVKSMATKFK